MQRLVEEVIGQVVGHFRLKGAAALRPLVEEAVQAFDVHKEVFRLADFRFGAREGAVGLDQIGGVVVGLALLAAVAVLILGMAARTFPFDEPVGQEGALLRIVQLRQPFSR